MELDVDRKTSIHQLAAANFKRTQEALRTVEESLNLVNRYELSKTYEKHRFKVYDIEKILRKYPLHKQTQMDRGLVLYNFPGTFQGA